MITETTMHRTLLDRDVPVQAARIGRIAFLALALFISYVWVLVSEEGGLSAGPFLIWLHAFAFLWLTRFYALCKPFEMALPIAGRALWATRTFWLVKSLLGWIACIVVSACLQSAVPIEILSAGVQTAAAILLGVAILRSGLLVQSEMNWPVRVGMMALAIAVTLPLVIAASAWPMAVAAAPAATAGGVFWWRYKRIPAGLRMAPDAAGPAMRGTRVREIEPGPVRFPLLRALYPLEAQFLLAGLFAYCAIVLISMQPLWILSTVLMLPGLFALTGMRRRLRLLGSLPVRRTRLFHALMLPSLAVWLCAVGLAWRLSGRFGELDAQTLAALGIACGILWSGSQVPIIESMRTPRGERRGHTAWQPYSVAVAAAYLIAMVGIMWLSPREAPLLPETQAVVRARALETLHAVTSLLPANGAGAFAVTLAVWASVYWLAARQFARSECEPALR